MFPPLIKRQGFLVCMVLLYLQANGQAGFRLLLPGSNHHQLQVTCLSPLNDNGFWFSATDLHAGRHKGFAIRVDHQGNPKDTLSHNPQIFSGQDHSYAGFAVGPDSSLFVAGVTDLAPVTNGTGTFLARLRPDGSLVWDHAFFNYPQRFSNILDMRILLEGLPDGGVVSLGPFGRRFSRLDSLGNLQFDLELPFSCTSLEVTAAGQYLFCGPNGLILLQANGNLDWIYQLNNLDADQAIETANGDFVISARGKLCPGCSQDYYLIRLDDSLQTQWAWRYDSPLDEWTESIQELSNGGFALAGWVKAGAVYWPFISETDSLGIPRYYRSFPYDLDAIQNLWQWKATCPLDLRMMPDGGFLLGLNGTKVSAAASNLSVEEGTIIRTGWLAESACLDSVPDFMSAKSYTPVLRRDTLPLKVVSGDSSRTDSLAEQPFAGNQVQTCFQACLTRALFHTSLPQEILTGDSLVFINGSFNASQFEWRVQSGGQIVGTGRDLGYRFTQPGDYQIELTAIKGPCMDVFSLPLRVCDTLFVDFGPDTGFCPDDSVLLNAGTGFASYQWSTGDTGQTLALNKPGLFSITVHTTEGCSRMDEIRVIADSVGTAGFSFSQVGYDVHFTASGNGTHSWNWSFGDGHNSSLAHPTHTYSQDGDYEVCLQISSGYGCRDSLCDTISIRVLSSPLQAGNAPLRLWPNPSTGVFQLDALPSSMIRDCQVHVLDASGRVVERWQGPLPWQADLTALPRGLYLLRVSKTSQSTFEQNFRLLLR